MARLMPSISECRQPYLLSNFDLVTASLTLMAGNSSSPFSCISIRRWTPVVVSSETPLMPLAIWVHRVGVLGQAAGQDTEHHRVLLGVGGRGVGHDARLLELDALVDQQGGVATVVEDQVRAFAARPAQHLLGAPPVVLEGLALPGVDRHAPGVVRGAVGAHGHRGGGVVLGGEDVAAGPPDLCAEGGEGLDQHGGLDGHVERTGDAGAGERLGGTELGTHGHQPGHLVLGQHDLLAAELGKRQIGDLEVVGA